MKAGSRWRSGICSAIGTAARKLPAFKGKCRIARNVARLILGNSSQTRLPIALHDGSLLSLDPRSRTEGSAFYNGVYDADDIEFFKCCLSADALTLDIGANVGLIAIPLALYTRSRGQLIAFEPVPSNARALRENIELNQLGHMTQVVECALGDQDGTLRIGRESGMGAGTGNAYTEKSATKISESLEWTVVPVRRLDDVLSQFSLTRIDLIKMDVEGAELEVLRGAVRTLQQFRPIIYGEFQLTLRPPSSGTFADVEQILRGLNYQPLAFSDRLQLIPVPYEPGRGNAVLCPVEKLDALRRRCDLARSGRSQ